MAVAQVLLAIVLLSGVYYLFIRSRGTVRYLRGPPRPSVLLGNQRELRYQAEVGDLEFAWVREYGPTFKMGGCWGTDILATADPKALQYIMHTAGYHFPKNAMVAQSSANIMGWGIASVQGEVHQRHRKVMNPAFTAQQLRTFLPLFQRSANRLTQKWKDEIQIGTKVFNVSRWLARLTLDAIGDAAFDYRFGALEDEGNVLSKCFENLFSDSVLYPSDWDTLFRALWAYIPAPILALTEYLPTREYKRFRHFKKLSQGIAKELIKEKESALAESTSRDVMSVLVRSNQSEDTVRKLNEEEVLSQMATLMLAGHETTASTTTWLLYELSRHPEDQTKIREEILALRKRTGRKEFTIADMEALEFTNACLKETLRLYPIVATLFRCSDRDDVIPLSTPVTNEKGETVSQVIVPKGQEIHIEIAPYNRLPSVWGEDADKWNPKRFLDDSMKDKQTSLGVLANLMTFCMYPF
ncbi:hypothetical protein HGRIS_005250 [Hohenbuehelia grisea]|uniref:Cytochrome P450 n=1 Tax=Hohenbuehelia grisea TaxID=104357 RepID=A0ABR3JEH9_9AGAR